MKIKILDADTAFNRASHGIRSNGGWLEGNASEGKFGISSYNVAGYYRIEDDYAEITFTRIPWFIKGTVERKLGQYLRGA